MTRPSRPIGVHAPVAGGLAKAALPYIDATAAESVQIFVSNPRGWALSKSDPKQEEAFVAGCAERGVPVFIHATLLVNLGSPTPATVTHSGESIAYALQRGQTLAAKGVVYHAGSAVDEQHTPSALGQVRDTLLPLLDKAAETGGPKLLVEPSAGGGRSLAGMVADLGPYFDALDHHPWLGVCLDTCHVWAAGHDLAAPGGMTACLDELVATVGAGRLQLVHANDSKDPRGSLRDRHENIGAGMLGDPPFVELLTHSATEGVAVIVETPSEGSTGHAADVAHLKELRKKRRPRKR